MLKSKRGIERAGACRRVLAPNAPHNLHAICCKIPGCLLIVMHSASRRWIEARLRWAIPGRDLLPLQYMTVPCSANLSNSLKPGPFLAHVHKYPSSSCSFIAPIQLFDTGSCFARATARSTIRLQATIEADRRRVMDGVERRRWKRRASGVMEGSLLDDVSIMP